MHGENAALVLLKLFVSGNERYHTTDAPLIHERNSFYVCKQQTIHHTKEPQKYNHTMIWRGINANINIMRYGISIFSDDICNLPGD